MQREMRARLKSLPKTEASFIEPMECLSVSKLPESAFCGDERYGALTLIGDLAKRNFAEKHHII